MWGLRESKLNEINHAREGAPPEAPFSRPQDTERIYGGVGISWCLGKPIFPNDTSSGTKTKPYYMIQAPILLKNNWCHCFIVEKCMGKSTSAHRAVL